MSLVLNVEILGEFKKLTSATTGAEKNLKGLQKSVGKISSGISKTLGALGVGFGLYAFVDFTKNAIRGAEAAQVADKRLIQVTESMNLFGKDTKEVTDRLIRFADKQELLTGVTAETTKQVQATLSTFKDLATSADDVGGNFDKATVAALDLAAAGFGTAETNAIQLGKALNDPIKGITALARAGVTFTESEKERIAALVESNRLGEAQTLILDAITKQVGGTAEATVTSGERMEAAFGQITDAVGLALLPVLEQFSNWLATPEGQDKIQEIITGLNTMIAEFVKLVDWTIQYKDALIPLAGAVVTFTAAWKAYNIVATITATKNVALGVSFKGLLGTLTLVVTALQTIDFINKNLTANGGWNRVAGNGAINFSGQSTAPTPTGIQGNMLMGTGTTTKPTTVNNIVINTPSTNPTAIVSTLQGYQNQTGANIRNLLR